VSVSRVKTKNKSPSQFTIEPSDGEFGLGLDLVAQDSTDDVAFRLGSLPPSKSWADTLPPIDSQGQQGSCVGWATAYYVKTSWENRSVPGWNETARTGQFSPAFVYNQINGGKDEGSRPEKALALMIEKGAATWADMPYSDRDFTTQPSAAVLASAEDYKNVDQRYFGDTFNLSSVKQYLANTGPLIFAIAVDDGFMHGTGDYTQYSNPPNPGGHAITCVGYDDSHGGGALLLANSWGDDWRDQGSVWVTYSAMADIYWGVWSMVDGPNAGGGGGAPGTPTGFAASAGESAAYVALTWDLLPGAKGFQLQKQSSSGAWQTIATPQADVFHHQDFDVEPAASYTYRLAGVGDDGTLGPYAEATGTTDSGGGGESIEVSASNPSDGGTAYPDRIALSWTTVAGDPLYVVLRSDSEEGFRNGQFIVLDFFGGATTFDDYVAPGSRYAYAIAVFSWPAFDFLGLSNVALGATSGGAGGATDIGIISLDEDVVVTRGFTADVGIELFNYGATSPAQWVIVGIEYYFANGATGILWYADDPDGFVDIYDEHHTDSSMQTFEFGWIDATPLTPDYLFPEGTADVGHWWYVAVIPSNSVGDEIDDADWYDNEMYGNLMLFVQ
ncbi:MAG: C1 family peptidase, partial [Planctomycetota bacterium]